MQRLAWSIPEAGREAGGSPLGAALSGAGVWLCSAPGRRCKDHRPLSPCRIAQLHAGAGAELGRMWGDGTRSLLGRSWGPGSVRPPVGASCRRVDSPSCNTSWESGQERLHMGIHTCERAHTAPVGPWTDPAPWCCCVVSPLALLVQAMCRVGLNPARPAPPPAGRVAQAAFTCVHACAPGSAYAQGAVHAGVQAAAAAHPLNQREKVPYLHVTVHIRVQEHAVTRTCRGQPRGGTRERFVGCLCFSTGHRVHLSGVCLRRRGGGCCCPGPGVSVLCGAGAVRAVGAGERCRALPGRCCGCCERCQRSAAGLGLPEEGRWSECCVVPGGFSS